MSAVLFRRLKIMLGDSVRSMFRIKCPQQKTVIVRRMACHELGMWDCAA